jgi:hypothetical protein
LIFSKILGAKLDPREPPNAPTSIPYIGHVLGLMRSSFNYYVELKYGPLGRVQISTN